MSSNLFTGASSGSQGALFGASPAGGDATPSMHHGTCGSCWTLSTVGALEGALAVAGRKLQDLPMQHILACDTGGAGCKGGSMDQAFGWVAENGVPALADELHLHKDGSASGCTAMGCGGCKAQACETCAFGGFSHVPDSTCVKDKTLINHCECPAGKRFKAGDATNPYGTCEPGKAPDLVIAVGDVTAHTDVAGTEGGLFGAPGEQAQDDVHVVEAEVTTMLGCKPGVSSAAMEHANPVENAEEDSGIHTAVAVVHCRFSDGEWKGQNMGDAKLVAHDQTGKLRFMLQHDALSKIVANHHVVDVAPYCDLQPNEGSEKCWAFTAQDFAEEKSKAEQFLLEFGNAELCQQFKEAFKSGELGFAIKISNSDIEKLLAAAAKAASDISELGSAATEGEKAVRNRRLQAKLTEAKRAFALRSLGDNLHIAELPIDKVSAPGRGRRKNGTKRAATEEQTPTAMWKQVSYARKVLAAPTPLKRNPRAASLSGYGHV